MEAQFERVTGYKLVGLGACTDWIRAGTYYHWVIAQQGQLGRCPRLAGIPPPYPPVTAAAPPVTAAALPVMAAASTQATIPNPPWEGGGRPQAEFQPEKRDAAAAGVQGTARDTGGAGDRAQILRITAWLHRLDLSTTYGAEIAASPRVEDYDIGPLLEYFLMPKLSDITLEEVATRVAQENRRDMEISLRDLHEERDSLRNEIELLASARDNEQRREMKKTLKRRLDTRRRELHSKQERISRLEELLGLEQSREPPTAQGRLDVIVEETTETTVMTAEEAESEATPPGGPTGDATAPVREAEQDMETEGPGSPVTPNEDDLLMGAGAADVETGIASLHVDSPAKPEDDGDTTT